MQRHPITTRGLLDVIIEGPPGDVGERWFQADLVRFSSEELREEARRLELRMLLTPIHERANWPACWIVDRLERVHVLLRAHRAADEWSKLRRR